MSSTITSSKSGVGFPSVSLHPFSTHPASRGLFLYCPAFMTRILFACSMKRPDLQFDSESAGRDGGHEAVDGLGSASAAGDRAPLISSKAAAASLAFSFRPPLQLLLQHWLPSPSRTRFIIDHCRAYVSQAFLLCILTCRFLCQRASTVTRIEGENNTSCYLYELRHYYLIPGISLFLRPHYPGHCLRRLFR